MRIVVAYDGRMDLPRGDTVRVLSLANQLARAGHRVSLVVPPFQAPAPGLEVLFRELDVRPLAATDKRANPLSQLRRKFGMMRYSKSLRPDVIQVETAFDAGVARLARVGPYVVDVHGLLFAEMVFNHGAFYWRNPPAVCRGIERHGVTGARFAVVVSESMRDWIAKEWNVARECMLVIPNGYLPERVAGVPEASRAPGGGIEATFVGALARWARVDKIVEAATHLQDADITFRIIGDGPDRGRLEQMCERAHLKNVAFSGFLPQPVAFEMMMRADVVLAPFPDTLALRVADPIKLIEYGALGRPMVIDPVSDAARALIAAGGAFAPIDDSPEAFAGAIRLALDDPARRRKVGETAARICRPRTWGFESRALADAYTNFRAG